MRTVFRTLHSIIHYDHTTGKMVILDGMYRVPMRFGVFWRIVLLRRQQCRNLGIEYAVSQDQQSPE